MKDLAVFAKEINKSAQNYDMKDFQCIRKQIHPGARGIYIFPSKTKHEDYAYHYGGRSELQFNIGFHGREELRYGIAFSLERGGYFGNPMDLKTKVQKLNEYLENHPTEFKDMRFWYWDGKNKKGIAIERVKPVSEDLVRLEMFLFWGKFAPKKTVQAQDVLSLFDRLLPVYEYVEGDATQTKQIKEFQFKLGNIRLEHTQARSKCETREINLRHNALVKTLYSILKLRKKHAGNADTGLLAQIDMVERAKDGLLYYEVKTGDDVKLCIRDALGQLLEYSYWPGAIVAKPLIIVTENQMTPKAYQYLKTLREQFSLPIFHQRLDMKSKTLEDMS